jgi:hypothetical protein
VTVYLTSQPLVQAHGLGLDSMGVTVELARLGVRPDAIMFANTRGEKAETYRYWPVLQEFARRVGFPEPVMVEYVVKDFKNWPPYRGLEENCLTNGTLPSLAFGFKSCSLKWKAGPQDKYLDTWAPALECWASGGRVKKIIGYDAGPKDIRRRNHAGNENDPKYQYWYPLQEWGWDRERCAQAVIAEQLPGWDPCYLSGGPIRWIEKGGIPLKSSCFFCPAMKGYELDALPKDKLRRIVILEARAKPRLEGFMTQAQLDERYAQQLAAWEKRGKKGKTPRRKTEGEPGLVKGLWRAKRMTEYIRAKGLLSPEEIDALAAAAPEEIKRTQGLHKAGEPIQSWDDFFEDLESDGLPMFCETEEDGDE